MIKELIRIFRKVEEDNNTYAKEFLDFYKQCINDFPKTLKSELARMEIKPCVRNNRNCVTVTWVLSFTLSDLLWWQERIENEPVYFKEPKVLKREIIGAALDVFDSLQISDEKYREYTRELIDSMASSIDVMSRMKR